MYALAHDLAHPGPGACIAAGLVGPDESVLGPEH